MNEARTKIGIFPVTDQDVRFFCDPTVHPNLENNGESRILYDQDYYYERKVTAYDFCEYALNLPQNSLTMNDVHMCTKAKDRIM